MTNHNLDDVESMDFIDNTDDSRDAATVSESNATVTAFNALYTFYVLESK